jgi:hypothetical protein
MTDHWDGWPAVSGSTRVWSHFGKRGFEQILEWHWDRMAEGPGSHFEYSREQFEPRVSDHRLFKTLDVCKMYARGLITYEWAQQYEAGL